MFNTNFHAQPLHSDGYDEYEAEIERQLAALGPLSEHELQENEDEAIIPEFSYKEPYGITFLPHQVHLCTVFTLFIPTYFTL